MNATYNLTNDRLKFYPDGRLSPEDYKEAKANRFQWWPGQKCLSAVWSPEAEDFIKSFCDIEPDDTPDDVAARVERFADYADRSEENAAAAEDRAANATTRRRETLAQARAVNETEKAAYWQHRIAGAISHAAHHDNPRTCANRVKGLQADLRRWQKSQKENAALLTLWTTGEITDEKAKRLENYGGGPTVYYLKSEYPASTYEGASSVWSGLDSGIINGQQAAQLSINYHTEALARIARWIEHLQTRIEYETAYLAAVGGAELIAPQPRKVAKAPEDGLKKGTTVSASAFLGGKCWTWNAQILSLGPKSVRVSYPPEFLTPGSKWGDKGVQIGRKYVHKVEA
jgi:hypothetical protein